MINKNQIKAIHALKNQAGLSEEEYRAFLSNWNVQSSKQMNQIQIKEALTALKKLINKDKITYKQISKINYLSDSKVNNTTAFCSKIVNRQINNLNDLTKKEGIRVINALSRYWKKDSN